MKAAFRAQAQGWRGRVVAAFAGRPVHVELVFADGTAFRCEHGAPCGFVAAPAADDPAWTWLDLTPLGLDEARARAYCASYDGTGYDLPRALFGWWLGIDTVGKPICCEVTADALVAAGAPPLLAQRPSTTPRRLLHALEQLLVARAAADLASREEAAFRSLFWTGEAL